MSGLTSLLEKLAENRGIHYALDHIQAAWQRLDCPGKNLSFIHLAGTNGKGSTGDFIAQLLEHQGYEVGIYSSPHMLSYTERFKLNGQNIKESKLELLVQELKLILKEFKLTEFEFLTMAALVWFSEQSPDYVVWETGLGGRLDATNIVSPRLVVITPIGIDHQSYLGNSLAEIAVEKAGIIKPGIGVVSIEQKSDVKDILLEKVCLVKTSIEWVEANGAYLDQNLALACRAVSLLLGKACESSSIPLKVRLPGRLEQVNQKPLVILDGAHNVHGITALIDHAKTNYVNTHIILSFSDRPIEDVKKMIQISLNAGLEVSFVQTEFFHALPPDKWRAIVIQFPEIEHLSWEMLRLKMPVWRAGSSDLKKTIVLAGSFYFLSRCRPYFTE